MGEGAVTRNAKLATKSAQDCAAIRGGRTALALARGFRQFASVLEVVKAKPCSSRRACMLCIRSDTSGRACARLRAVLASLAALTTSARGGAGGARPRTELGLLHRSVVMLRIYAVVLELNRSLVLLIRGIERHDSDLARQLKRAMSSVPLHIAEGTCCQEPSRPLPYGTRLDTRSTRVPRNGGRVRLRHAARSNHERHLRPRARHPCPPRTSLTSMRAPLSSVGPALASPSAPPRLFARVASLAYSPASPASSLHANRGMPLRQCR